MIELLGQYVASEVKAINLLALNDEGAPRYYYENAQSLANLGLPVFACTPNLFPDLMGAAIEGRDLNEWAGSRDIAATRPQPGLA